MSAFKSLQLVVSETINLRQFQGMKQKSMFPVQIHSDVKFELHAAFSS